MRRPRSAGICQLRPGKSGVQEGFRIGAFRFDPAQDLDGELPGGGFLHTAVCLSTQNLSRCDPDAAQKIAGGQPLLPLELYLLRSTTYPFPGRDAEADGGLTGHCSRCTPTRRLFRPLP